MTYRLFGEKGFLGKALAPYCCGDASAPVWINAMGKVRGIQGNRKSQGTMMSENLKSAIAVFDEAVEKKCKRVVNFGSTCAYSPASKIPFEPRDYHHGLPELTNYGYAMAKRAIHELSVCYNDEFGMDNLYLVMPNLYGPRCAFGEDVHVIPDMIQKIQTSIDENRSLIVFLGTGAAEREFLFIDDAVSLILKAIDERHDVAAPIHLTSGSLIKIKDLAEMLIKKMGYAGNVHWAKDFPDGQLKRQLAPGLSLDKPTPFEEGLDQTIAYYRSLRVPA